MNLRNHTKQLLEHSFFFPELYILLVGFIVIQKETETRSLKIVNDFKSIHVHAALLHIFGIKFNVFNVGDFVKL